MLAPLGFFLLYMLIALSMVLLLCWAYDTDRAEVEAGRSRLADSEFGLDPIAYEWPPYYNSMDEFGSGMEKYHAA
jgi:hypothetical protein